MGTTSTPLGIPIQILFNFLMTSRAIENVPCYDIIVRGRD